MPFGISLVPKVFQWRIHELIESLHGVKVVADDFVAIGFGSTQKEMMTELGRQRCEQWKIHLNADKVKFRMNGYHLLDT